MSARTPIILTDFFCMNYHAPHYENAGMVPLIRQLPFLFTDYPVNCSLLSSHFNMRCLRASLYKVYSVARVRERTIPTERPPLVGEVSANFCG
jgi:hypothetical protein